MDLKTYLATAGVRQSEFADLVETTPATISRLAKGKMGPALELAHRIERATGGKVPTESWLQVPAPSVARAARPTEQTP